MKKTKKQKNKKTGGFSIVELLITLAIFGVITSMILARNSDFNNSIKLKNLAYEVALSVRQAQIFGTSVKGFGSGTQDFNLAYGVHFGSGSADSFILFADLNDNGEYDNSNEIVEVLNMRGGNKIDLICVIPLGGIRTCGNPTNSNLNIVFKRPSHIARIDTDILLGVTFTGAEIYLDSSSGEERKVVVQGVGQISVE